MIAIVSSDEVYAYLNQLESDRTPVKKGKGFGAEEINSQCTYKFIRL